jgi:hypothetical protein
MTHRISTDGGHVHRLARVLPVVAVCAAILGIPASSARATVLKGQVVVSPYPSDNRAAIPVLLDPVSAKRARLDSPVGVFLVSPGKAVPTPAGPVLPLGLRPGDRLQANGRVGRAARHSPYFRLSVGPRGG